MRNAIVLVALMVVIVTIMQVKAHAFSILLDHADSPRDSIVNVIELPGGGMMLARVAVVMQVSAEEIDSLQVMVPFTVWFRLWWDCEGVGPEFECVGQHGTVINIDYPEPGDPAFEWVDWSECLMIVCGCVAHRYFGFEVNDVQPMGRMAVFWFTNEGYDPTDCSGRYYPAVSMYTERLQNGGDGGVFTMMWDTVGAESTTWGRIKSLYQ
jgi:hypothetical protein